MGLSFQYSEVMVETIINSINYQLDFEFEVLKIDNPIKIGILKLRDHMKYRSKRKSFNRVVKIKKLQNEN